MLLKKLERAVKLRTKTATHTPNSGGCLLFYLTSFIPIATLCGIGFHSTFLNKAK